ncbi:MAG: LapA family protein [Ilumatobacter sp.]|nr:MAG: LapA family protein [Ilumatobacter sp.]
MTIDQERLPGRDDARRNGIVFSGGAIASGSGVAALLVFILQNTADVAVKFLFWDFTWPVWLLIIVSASLGAAIWLGLGIMRRRRRRKARRAARTA